MCCRVRQANVWQHTFLHRNILFCFVTHFYFDLYRKCPRTNRINRQKQNNVHFSSENTMRASTRLIWAQTPLTVLLRATEPPDVPLSPKANRENMHPPPSPSLLASFSHVKLLKQDAGVTDRHLPSVLPDADEPPCTFFSEVFLRKTELWIFRGEGPRRTPRTLNLTVCECLLDVCALVEAD